MLNPCKIDLNIQYEYFNSMKKRESVKELHFAQRSWVNSSTIYIVLYNIFRKCWQLISVKDQRLLSWFRCASFPKSLHVVYFYWYWLSDLSLLPFLSYSLYWIRILFFRKRFIQISWHCIRFNHIQPVHNPISWNVGTQFEKCPFCYGNSESLENRNNLMFCRD